MTEIFMRALGNTYLLWVFVPCLSWNWRSFAVLTGLAATIFWLLHGDLQQYLRCAECDHGAGDALGAVFFSFAVWVFICLALGRFLTLSLKQAFGWPRYKAFLLELTPLCFLVGVVCLSLAILKATQTH